MYFNYMDHLVSGIVESMSHPVDSILLVSQKLNELRERAVALDAERAAVQEQINDCLNELSSSLEGQRIPPPDGFLTDRIIAVLQQNRTRPMAPMDVADVLGITNHKALTNVRVMMSRMWRDGKIGKVARARYVPRER